MNNDSEIKPKRKFQYKKRQKNVHREARKNPLYVLNEHSQTVEPVESLMEFWSKKLHWKELEFQFKKWSKESLSLLKRIEEILYELYFSFMRWLKNQRQQNALNLQIVIRYYQLFVELGKQLFENWVSSLSLIPAMTFYKEHAFTKVSQH